MPTYNVSFENYLSDRMIEIIDKKAGLKWFNFNIKRKLDKELDFLKNAKWLYEEWLNNN